MPVSVPSVTQHPASDLAIAEGQLRDYQARIGQPFPHDAYLAELTKLRDELRPGLPDKTSDDGVPIPMPDLAERIKALRAAYTVQAASGLF